MFACFSPTLALGRHAGEFYVLFQQRCTCLQSYCRTPATRLTIPAVTQYFEHSVPNFCPQCLMIRADADCQSESLIALQVQQRRGGRLFSSSSRCRAWPGELTKACSLVELRNPGRLPNISSMVHVISPVSLRATPSKIAWSTRMMSRVPEW